MTEKNTTALEVVSDKTTNVEITLRGAGDEPGLHTRKGASVSFETPVVRSMKQYVPLDKNAEQKEMWQKLSLTGKERKWDRILRFEVNAEG
jgi:hypothetical protein